MEEPYRYILLLFFTLLCQLVFIYLQQRAKNKADLDVKKKLTSIEEGIKTVNALQIERSKQIFSEEKNSIIVFFAQLNTWIWESLVINYNNYNEANYEQIQTKLIEIQTGFNKTMIEYSKVVIIIADSELVQAGKNAINETCELRTFQDDVLSKIYVNLKISSLLYNELIKIQVDSPETNDYSQFSRNQDEYRKKTIELNELRTNYFSKDALASTIKAINTFQELARKYIRKESPNKMKND